MQDAAATAPLETITGHIIRITFHHEETGFCVLKVKAKGHRDLISVVGHSVAVTEGEWLQGSGTWEQDRQYGKQFKAQILKITPPTTQKGIERYLASGCIKGIGAHFAEKIVQKFGEAVFTIIEDKPEELLTIPGMGKKRLKRIIASWGEQKYVRDIMVFLHSYGISASKAVRIYKVYGDQSIAKIHENPYCLAHDIRGIGFLNADKIALALGIEPSSIIRARAGISYALLTATKDGHCGLPIQVLLERAQALLSIDASILEQALALEITEKLLIQDSVQNISCVFLPEFYQAEKGIAECLHFLTKGSPPWGSIDFDQAIAWVEKNNNIQLSQSQKQALIQALSSKITIITGGPGVGKTTLLRSILQILRAKEIKVILGAPTGRAAKRMAEATGMEAKTIHRLLAMAPQSDEYAYSYSGASELSCGAMVIDEVSMVDVPLMSSILKALPANAALLLVGDKDQLPSVGPGHVLGDMIASGAIPCIHLTEIFRQAQDSQIVSVAHTINNAEMPKLQGHGVASDFFFLEANSPEDALQTILSLATKRLPAKFGYSPLHDIQILCPMTRGPAGTHSINAELQKILTPPSKNSIERFGLFLSPGDKVIQTSNNYDKEVFNGDIGFIQSIDTEEEEVLINFEGREVAYDFTQMDEISLAYALTIHKSQGSEYPVVIIPLLTAHYPMLYKNLVYTGITRGKKLVIMVGQKRAVAMSVSNAQARKRWSMLETRLGMSEPHS
ncbi:MAG: ATP-dependent RecD-like DNA helicase [Alphaproteobacteria bacterium]